MRKLFILLGLILATTVVSYSQDTIKDTEETVKETVMEVYDDAKAQSYGIYDDAKSAIKELGAALKVGSEHVYEVLIRQQYVKAIVGLFVLLLIIASMISVIVIGPKAGWLESSYPNGDILAAEPEREFGFKSMFTIALSLFAVILLVAFFAGGFYTDIVQGFVNPEYGAMQEIVSMIKDIK